MSGAEPIYGRFVVTQTGDEAVKAFVPASLSPIPPLQLHDFYQDLDRANQALGRLDGLQSLLPNLSILLYFYSRREAVLSSQIEGTQSSLSDLLLFEKDVLRGSTDADEVHNYLAAMEHGLERIRRGFPLSNRLFREMHAILLRSGRGAEKTPGEFRTSQNWIGGQRPGTALYVPPPANELAEVMADLERFLHRETDQLPLLVDIAIAHVQFESAHPFLDGNGRIGRLLITLLLCERGVMRDPSFYLSLYFKQHRERYYELLQRVRMEGDWKAWLRFFLRGVWETAEQACTLAGDIRNLLMRDRERIRMLSSGGALLRLHTVLEASPLVGLPEVCDRAGLAPATASKAMEAFEREGMVREITGKKRDRIYEYTEYLRLLSGGTEPIRPEK